MRIPNKGECLALLAKHSVPETIQGHSKQVARVAVFLAENLKEKGEKVDVKLVEASALLHDIDKMACLEDENKRHALEGAKLLEEEGLPEIAEIVKQHRLRHILEQPFSSLEAKIVYYADKRVRHTEIVSLDERFEYLLERYGKLSKEFEEDILEAKPKVEALEKEIFGKLGVSPKMEGLD